MKYRTPAVYHSFHCPGGTCSDNCCIGWEVTVDPENAARYRALEGPLGDRLRAVMTEKDGELQFPLVNGQCPFLDESHLCELQKAGGEDLLCHTCREFPRFTNEYGNLVERGLSFSCPEVTQLVLSSPKPITFHLETDDQPVTHPNNIPAELFLQLRPIRQQLVGLLQDRSMPIWQRVGLCLKLTRKVQDKLDHNKTGDLTKLREKYSRIRFLEKQKQKLGEDKGSHLATRAALAKLMLRLDPLTERWIPFWEQIHHAQKMELMLPHHADIQRHQLAKLMQPREYEYEHFLVYLVYRYFLESVYQGDVYWRMKFTAASLLAVAELDLRMMQALNGELPQAAQMDLMCLFSREVEHSPENMAAFQEALLHKGKFGRKELTGALRELLNAD